MPSDNSAEDHGQFGPSPFKSLIGQRASGCRLGYGSVLFLGFGGDRGEHDLPEGCGSEWSIWNDQILWRIEQGDQVLAGSEDDRESMEAAVQQINGRALASGETDGDSGDSVLTFTDDLVLRTFLLTTEDNPLWNLSQRDSKSVLPGSVGNSKGQNSKRRTVEVDTALAKSRVFLG